MMSDFDIDGLRISKALDPILSMLDHKKSVLGNSEWVAFVSDTKKSILNNPSQYIDLTIIKSGMLKELIELAFNEFLKTELSHSVER